MTSKDLSLKLDQMTAYAAAAQINYSLDVKNKYERAQELNYQCELIKSIIMCEFNGMKQYLKDQENG